MFTIVFIPWCKLVTSRDYCKPSFKERINNNNNNQFVIYRIQHVKKIRTPNGQDSIILYLYARNSTEPKIVWASSLLATELLAMKEIKNLYIKSCGLKKSLITGREYYNYQLVQKQ